MEEKLDLILEKLKKLDDLDSEVKGLNEFKLEARDEFRQINIKFEKIDDRFEQVDKRFEQVDKRFEQVDKRFEQVDKRFEQVDKRFEQVDKRFEQVDKRFDKVELDLNKVAVIAINNQKNIEDIQGTVNRTAHTIDKLYNKIDNFLVTAQKNEEEIAVIGHRQREHENRITALEEKIA